jgi:hypothetical protein
MVNQLSDYDEQLLMDDLDLEELMECEDIELNPFFSQGKHVMSILDNVICSLDDRINYKRSGFYGGYGNSTGIYGAEEYGAGSFNTAFGGYKGNNQSSHGLIKNNGHGMNAAEKFDKQRTVSLLY